MNKELDVTESSPQQLPHSEKRSSIKEYVPIGPLNSIDNNNVNDLIWPDLDQLGSDTLQRITRKDIQCLIQEQCKLHDLEFSNGKQHTAILVDFLNQLFYNDPKIIEYVGSLAQPKISRQEGAFIGVLTTASLISVIDLIRNLWILGSNVNLTNIERDAIETELLICSIVTVVALLLALLFCYFDKNKATIRNLEGFIQKTVMIKKTSKSD